MIRLLLASVLLSCFQLQAQQLDILNKEYKTSIRGLSVVDNHIIWVSGSNGMVGRSTDQGKTWDWIMVPGMEKRDFRDIEAFDANTAVIMAIAEPAVILLTNDAGKTWKTVFSDSRPGMFLDAMDFQGTIGYVIGDPINGKMFLAKSTDNGNSWQEIMSPELNVQPGEACFASSGTNIITRNDGSFLVLTGGTASRILSSKSAYATPLIQGKETTGGNSMALYPNHQKKQDLMVIAGGDFSIPQSSDKNLFYSTDNGANWTTPLTPPKGYKSCVSFITDRTLVTCGTSGIDISSDSGRNWKHISDESYHVVAKAKKGNLVILAGANGRIASMKF